MKHLIFIQITELFKLGSLHSYYCYSLKLKINLQTTFCSLKGPGSVNYGCISQANLYLVSCLLGPCGGSAEHEDAFFLLQDDWHYDRGHHKYILLTQYYNSLSLHVHYLMQFFSYFLSTHCSLILFFFSCGGYKQAARASTHLGGHLPHHPYWEGMSLRQLKAFTSARQDHSAKLN